MKQGEYSQIVSGLLPEPNDSAMIYSSDDESVMTVGYNGVILAVGPGTAVVHVEAAGENAISSDVTVTVEAADQD